MKRITLALLVLAIVASWCCIFIQRQTINALIDLNHDKSLFIDAGCRGQFHGSEEKLSEEK